MLATPLDLVAQQAGGTLAVPGSAEPAVTQPRSDAAAPLAAGADSGPGSAGRADAGEMPLVTGVTRDNRHVTPGDLFIAIAGARVDGNRFAGDALARGAAGILTADRAAAQASGADPRRIIAVPDVYRALAQLAHAQLEALRALPDSKLTVVALTGSVGKTTTKDLLSELLVDRGPVIAPPGSFNNELGLPLTVLRADEHTATLVLEMGAGKPGDLSYLTAIAQPDIALELIVARAHMGFLGGIEQVAAEKRVLVEQTRPGGHVILNGDDPRVVAMSAAARGPVSYFSARAHVLEAGLEADVYATDITLDSAGHPHFWLHTPTGQTAVTLALVGEHNVHNALAAASVALTLGIPLARIAHILAVATPLSAHRLRVTPLEQGTLIDDSYNANPDSMRAGIAAAAHIARGRPIIAVLGEMAELGETSAAEHRAIGAYLAQQGVDTLVAIGDGVAQLLAAAKASGVPRVVHKSIAQAPEFVAALLRPDTVVLVKGSHSSGAWQVADALAALAPAQGEQRKQKGEQL